MGNSTSFTRLVDDAIRSASPSVLRDSSLRSFGSLIDSAIHSNYTSITDAEFDSATWSNYTSTTDAELGNIFCSFALWGSDHFEIAPATSQYQHFASLRSFGSLIDSAIRSNCTSTTDAEFEIAPATSQHQHFASFPSNTLNFQTLQNQTHKIIDFNSDKSKSSQSDTDTENESWIPKNSLIPHIPAQTFTFRELAVATKYFSPECLLEVGEFNRLYKGCLESTGQVVAVKQIDRNDIQGYREFLVELFMLHLLHHPNLMNLIGYCSDGDLRLLVYEFMPLGSLEDNLFDLPPDKEPLDWNTRMKIAAGVAKGLEYLHDKSNPAVIYRNLKPSDILLDESYHPKLSDFGLAKLGPVGDKNHVSTRVTKTYVYIDPKYVMTGQLSLISDIYCFGVVLLELVTGRKAIDNKRGYEELNLVEWVRPLLNDRDKFFQLADPLLQGRYPMEGLCEAIEVAAMCIHDQGTARPPIRDVVTALTFLASQTYG